MIGQAADRAGRAAEPRGRTGARRPGRARACAALLALLAAAGPLCAAGTAAPPPTGAAPGEATAAPANPPSGDPARLRLEGSGIAAEGRDRGAPRPLSLTLALDRPVAWRSFLLGAPPRLVLDLEGAALPAAPAGALAGAGLVPALRWGALEGGRARLVVELPGPMAVARADEAALPEGGARIAVGLVPVAPEAFAPRAAGDALTALWGLPEPSLPAAPPPRRPGPLRVMLDPGHGGFDPGAAGGGLTEAPLMLAVAHEIAAALAAAGAEPALTRDGDRFLPLERRMTAARAAGADLLISLHADALPAGEAAGAAVYVWNSAADDRAAGELAQRHDRDDLLAGLDLAAADDEVAAALMDIARTDTQPRSENLARFLVSEFALGRIAIARRPVKGAAFSVLKAPDIPAVLVETGFLSDPADRANLADPAWRAALARAVTRAVLAWAEDDAARAPLLRR